MLGFVQVVKIIALVIIPLCLQGCVGTIVGAVVDTTIEVVKVPFKVGKAVVDVATDDDEKKEE